MMKQQASPEQILAAMSFEEKLSQLRIVWKPKDEDSQHLARTGAGALFWPADAAKTNELQRIAVEESPHGIPLLIALDIVHGQFTIFPTPLAQAASFDPDVAEVDARVSAAEARATGVNWTFSPMIDVSRDPRWGRVVEGFGEDPYLTGVFGAAKIRGYQGQDLSSPGSIAACAKHFVAYSAAEGGRDYNTTDVSIQRLRNVYLEPFHAAVKNNVASVMASFNALSGVPMHANRQLLTDVLKDEWKHQGIVVADAGGVGELVEHGVAADIPEAGRLALSAGLDVEMGGALFNGDMPIITEGDVDPRRIDDAVLRILKLKQDLGLFNNPYVDEDAAPVTAGEEQREKAREAAARCTVLLKNDGQVLPLKKQAGRVLVVGPYADSTDHLGAWVQYFATPAGKSIVESLGEALPDAEITALPGAGFYSTDPALQDEAARAAKDADVVIVAVGEPGALSGEASSRSDISLPGDQTALIHRIAETGTPFAVVLMTGRPLILSDWIDECAAVLLAWHLGTEAGPAIADVLTGKANPGGKLPMSFPRSVGQIPVYYNHDSTGRPARHGGTLTSEQPDVGLTGPNNTDDFYKSKYLDLDLGPLFDFGFGLSYSAFHLESEAAGPGTVALSALENGGTVDFTTSVRNTSNVDGDEVVQLYITDVRASITQPVRRLRRFTRIHVPAGQSRDLSFSLSADDLGFWTNKEAGEFVLEPGEFRVTVGDGSTFQTLAFTVTHH
ncbi:glycoside hydrolase family 3 C-terminal domain-containing protein [Paenarthrobacter ilicis]|uniref:glycoside hydrolase family 3 N-terminal domain-containing protein n=1 Tax=Paenarthrobacter ilicis TaxID=43665 RepID=UPI00300BA196